MAILLDRIKTVVFNRFITKLKVVIYGKYYVVGSSRCQAIASLLCPAKKVAVRGRSAQKLGILALVASLILVVWGISSLSCTFLGSALGIL
jgi:hypothetical protein